MKAEEIEELISPISEDMRKMGNSYFASHRAKNTEI